MNDTDYMSKTFERGSTVSGPWRLTVWEKQGVVCYLFSEEHGNEGACPENKDITVLAKEVLSNTDNVHVFIEHFVHALDINKVDMTETEACSARSEAMLNNMRNCLEVLRVERGPGEKKRIHFVDPRMDIVAVLPDGRLYEAISHYTQHLVKKGDLAGALMTIYEAFIHPLLSIVPDKFGVDGRMTGVMERFRKQMTDAQKEFFLTTWNTEVVQKIKALSDKYVSMQEKNDVSGLDQFKLAYTDMVNKFMDMCLLAQFFVARNNGMTAALVYAGSLHSMNFETYLQKYGYKRTRLHQSRNLQACVKL